MLMNNVHGARPKRMGRQTLKKERKNDRSIEPQGVGEYYWQQ